MLMMYKAKESLIYCWWEYINYSHSAKQFLKNQAELP